MLGLILGRQKCILMYAAPQARMKRLAECVPGREIRAGARKLLHNRSAFTIKVPYGFVFTGSYWVTIQNGKNI